MKKVYGLGINDANYVVSPVVNGKRIHCPFYTKWKSMLERCYCPKSLAKRPSYKGCHVVDEWLSFTNFKNWMEKQDWVGKHIDKDLLLKGNKTYGPDFCIFVEPRVNSFLLERNADRGDYLIGVSWCEQAKSLTADISINGKQKRLGRFKNQEDAHECWRNAKHNLALSLASEQTDPRVREALENRYK